MRSTRALIVRRSGRGKAFLRAARPDLLDQIRHGRALGLQVYLVDCRCDQSFALGVQRKGIFAPAHRSRLDRRHSALGPICDNQTIHRRPADPQFPSDRFDVDNRESACRRVASTSRGSLLRAGSPPPFASAPGRLQERLPRPSPPADLVKTLGGQILTLNGFVNPYSQVKWIFSTKMAQHKALILFKLNSHAKTAPDTGQAGNVAGTPVYGEGDEVLVKFRAGSPHQSQDRCDQRTDRSSPR